jgi:hypothetical protein
MRMKTRGRPRNTLIGLVKAGTWSAANWRHQHLLGAEDLPPDFDPELLLAQERFRAMRQAGGGWARWEADWFERRLRELQQR